VIYPPAAPGVPGLVFRRFRGEADYPNIVAAISGSKQADGIERTDTLEDVARNYAHLHNCDPFQDMIFAEVDGQAIGYGRVWWDLNGNGEWLGFNLAFLLPAWRRKGIGRAILRHNENRLRQIAAEQVARGELSPAAQRFFDLWVADTEAGKDALARSAGYQPVRYAFSMRRDLAELVEVTPLPAGLEICPVPAAHYRTVWDAAQEAFRDHWSFVEEPEEEYRSWLASAEFDPSLWKVAWDGDQVAGMVLNFVNRKENEEYQRERGYTESICVRRPWRQRGLARALLTRSLQMFKDMDMTEAALGVDAENLTGALRLYESVGFRVTQRFTTYRKGF
jgi:ribosomal protein S18 acetylase RimI-like enzyme